MASSVIFIGLKVQRDVDNCFCELEHYGPLNINSDEEYVTFAASSDDFIALDKIISKICHWFYERLADPDCEENIDSIIELYGNDEFHKALNCDLKGIISLTVFSRIEYYDEPFGVSFLEYDAFSKELTIINRTLMEEKDPYGYDLEDRYRKNNTIKVEDTSKQKIYNKYNWKEAIVPDGYQMCSACYKIIPQNEIILKEVRGEKYPFCPKCTIDFFGE